MSLLVGVYRVYAFSISGYRLFWKLEISILTIDWFIVDSLKPVIYLKEDIIYKAGIEGDCMYFIASGTVVLITFSGKEVTEDIYRKKIYALFAIKYAQLSMIFLKDMSSTWWWSLWWGWPDLSESTQRGISYCLRSMRAASLASSWF